MLEILSLKPKAFGLDISDLSLRIVNLERKRGGFKLSSFGEAKIPSGIIKNGEIKKEEDLVKIIKKAAPEVQGKPLKTKYVIASLPEEKSFLKVIQMPRLQEEELKSAIVYEAESHIPLPIEEVYLDSWVIPPLYDHLDHQDVLLVALPRTTVNPYVSCLKKAGLKPLALEIEPFSMIRALIKDGVSNFPVLILDLGATKTSLIIFSGYSLRFSFFIPISSDHFTELISKTMKVNLDKAEKLKLKYGIETRGTKEGGEVFEALIPALVDLIEQIKRYIDYYVTHTSHEHLPPSKNGKIKKILLSGGGANLKGLTGFLSEQLKIPVEIGNPWTNILLRKGKKVQEISFEKSLSYTSALGLALRGIKE